MARITDRADRVVAKIFQKPSPVQSERDSAVAKEATSMVAKIKAAREQIIKGAY